MQVVKLKSGCVNSSVTAFLIYGVRIDGDEEEPFIEAVVKLGFDADRYKYEGGYDIYELLSDIAREAGLEDYIGCDGNFYYLGLTPTEIRDNETGGQFKTRVEQLITKVFGEKMKCRYYEETF